MELESALKDIERTNLVLAEVNLKVMTSHVRSTFKEIWASFYSRWLEFNQKSLLFRAPERATPKDLAEAEKQSADFKKRGLLLYEAWKREPKGEGAVDGGVGVATGALGIIGATLGFFGIRALWRKSRESHEAAEAQREQLDRHNFLAQAGLLAPPQPQSPITIVNAPGLSPTVTGPFGASPSPTLAPTIAALARPISPLFHPSDGVPNIPILPDMEEEQD